MYLWAMEKLTRLLFFLLMGVFPYFVSAQKEANIWYFGENAGLDFTSGAPVYLLNSAMNKDEGCSSVSNPSGNLLFYTDGIHVWNKNHQQMPNGFGLAGHESSTQSALIVPKPGSSTLYYIFTSDAFFYANGLRYSVVDLSLQGGLGDVTIKNTLLHTPSTEKVTAVKHTNGTDIWVISHGGNSNLFHAYLVTASGVSAPVSTGIGSMHSGGGVSGTLNAIGSMKVSPDGSRLALAIYNLSLVELFDFSTSTGLVSNPVSFPAIYTNVYGIEFSSDISKLFFTSDTTVYQANLNAGSASAIVNSTQAAGNINWGPFGPGTNYLGALQLGPDGRIYGTSFFSEYLFVIQNPNAPGIECGFVEQGVWLGGKHCYGGLPGFVQSYFNTVPQNVTYLQTEAEQLNVYPNPSEGTITIRFPSGTEKINIINSLGVLVMDLCPNPSGIAYAGNLAKGNYFLLVETGREILIRRLTVL